MKDHSLKYFVRGAKAMTPIISGVLPFGLIMGALGNTAQLSGLELGALNVFVFAGVSQLVAVEQLMRDVPSSIIIITGLIINLRLVLYSVSMSEVLKGTSKLTKTLGAYLITDQAYAAYIGNSHEITNKEDRVYFYFGAGLCMSFFWQLFVMLGYIFGNFLPESLNLDFVVPLSFMALVMPTLRNKNYYYVTLISVVCSILFYKLPYNLGLLVAGGIALICGVFLTRRKNEK